MILLELLSHQSTDGSVVPTKLAHGRVSRDHGLITYRIIKLHMHFSIRFHVDPRMPRTARVNPGHEHERVHSRVLVFIFPRSLVVSM